MMVYLLYQVDDDYYSDWQVRGIYSTMELAMKAKANFGQPKGFELKIEQEELDSKHLDE